MSGLDVIYDGIQLVKEKSLEQLSETPFHQNVNENNAISFATRFSLKFKPSFKIKEVIKNSPAHAAGLLKVDVILIINGKQAHNFTIGELLHKFQERDKNKIKMTIRRNGVEMKFEFRLHKSV